MFCWKRTRRISALTVLACGLVVGTSWVLFVAAPEPGSSVVRTVAIERDLPAIAEEGVLRVALPADDVAYARRGRREDGLAYDLAAQVASRLGLRLEVHVVEQAGTGLRDLARGKADLLAVIDPGPRPVHDEAAWSAPIEQSRAVLLGREAAGIRCPEDLRGREVFVRRDTFLEAAAFGWREVTGGALDIRGLPPRWTDEELAAAADGGRFPLVVMDERRARLERALYPGLELSAPLGDPLPVRWATRPNAPLLLARVSEILDRARERGVVAELQRRYLEDPRRIRHSRHFAAWQGEGVISPWDGLLQQAGTKHGLDWRFLAALVAIESGFDPASVGPGGSLGLMQLMPATARAFGADDPLDPQQNVLAGARHLRWLWNLFPEVPDPDRLAFTLAAYNMGLGHLEDVRGLALAHGLDPNRWEGNVAAVLPLKESAEIAASLPHGFARGTLTKNYVGRVLDRYRQWGGEGRAVVRVIASAGQRS